MSKLKGKIYVILLIFIILLQSIIAIYSANKRENFHMDEYYSHGLIQYDKPFIMSNEDFYNNWHEAQYFKDYVTLKEQDKWDFRAVYKNQVQDVHPPVYYLLLRIACSFNLNNFSKWPGIILNIIVAIICTVILYLIGNRIYGNKYIALLTCFVNAMCIATIEAITFIRMYELVTLNCLLLIYYHIINRDKKLGTKDLIIFSILVITGFLTHYYYAFIVAVLYFMYLLKYAKEKNKKELAKYTATLAISVLIAILIFPYSMFHIFFGYRGQEVFSNIENFSRIADSLKDYIRILGEHILNGNAKSVLILILGLSIIAITEKIWNKKHNTIKKDDKKDYSILYVLIPTLVYFFATVMGCEFSDLRYIMPITPLVIISIIYVIKKLISTWANLQTTYVIITVLSLLFCYTNIPRYSDNGYTEKGTNARIDEVVSKIGNRPFILLTHGNSGNDSKFIETYQMVSKVKETYIMDVLNINKEILQSALENKDASNGVVIMFRWQREEEALRQIYSTRIFSECNIVARGILTYYNIYELK